MSRRRHLLSALGLAAALGWLATPSAWAESLAALADAGDGAGLTHGVLGESLSREGSGTAWRPEADPVPGVLTINHGFLLIAEGIVEASLGDMVSPRSGEGVLASTWFRGQARHELAGGQLGLRVMLSADPMFVPEGGYPELLQAGNVYAGAAVHDRQLARPLFMEVAATYARPLAAGMAIEAYLAPVGEPALGPTSAEHRASGEANPLAPVGSGHLESTHVSFGVATLAAFNRWAKVEASAFNGRELGPDRGSFPLASLDSWSARLQLSPIRQLAAQLSYGHLGSPMALLPGVSQERVTASISATLPLDEGGSWASTIAWGSVDQAGVRTHAVLAESEARVDRNDTVFGRIEWVQRTAAELALPSLVPAGLQNVSQVTVGYLRELDPIAGVVLGVGAQGLLSFVPTPLEHLYGGSAAPGLLASVRLRFADLPH